MIKMIANSLNGDSKCFTIALQAGLEKYYFISVNANTDLISITKGGVPSKGNWEYYPGTIYNIEKLVTELRLVLRCEGIKERIKTLRIEGQTMAREYSITEYRLRKAIYIYNMLLKVMDYNKVSKEKLTKEQFKLFCKTEYESIFCFYDVEFLRDIADREYAGTENDDTPSINTVLDIITNLL